MYRQHLCWWNWQNSLVAKLYNLLNKKIKNIVVAKKFYQDQIDEIKLLEKNKFNPLKSRIDLIDDAIKK